ncbi:MAG: hypothetical protein P8080_12130 [Gammaproteobacteria bacterium]
MPNQTAAGSPATPPVRERWALIRDVAVLQAKLLADALRDLLLAPLALVAAAVDLVRPGGGLFDEVLRLGRRTDRWINLFGHEAAGDSEGEASLDELASRLERRIREKYEAGGVTAQAKEALDRALDAVSGKGEDRK